MSDRKHQTLKSSWVFFKIVLVTLKKDTGLFLPINLLLQHYHHLPELCLSVFLHSQPQLFCTLEGYEKKYFLLKSCLTKVLFVNILSAH